ncbi:MAG: glycosyl hydrolase family 17, partial [Bacteroidia bacterium]|nr:glycosyl hydrolase family 17 [Bacteroidia bacterium]
MFQPRLKYFLLALGLIVIILSSCSFSNEAENENKQIFNKTAAQILGDTNYQAICYGGYRTNTRDSLPTLAQIKDDLKLLDAIGIKILRTYNTKYTEIDSLLEAIRALKAERSSFEMYVMLGAWIDCENAWSLAEPKHDKENLEANTAEINRAIQLANQYPDIVKIISVGNEAMVKWATSYYVTPDIIVKWVNHLQKLKAEGGLPKDVWITSSDNFASWGGGDSTYHTKDLEQLYNAVDYVSIHTYPMHDTHYNPVFWRLEPKERSYSIEVQLDSLMHRAINYAKNQYLGVYQYMKS